MWTLWKAAELPSKQIHSSQTHENMSGPVCPHMASFHSSHSHSRQCPQEGHYTILCARLWGGCLPTTQRAPCDWGLLPYLGSMPQGRLLGSCQCSPPICRQVESPLFLAELPPCCWESFACLSPTSASPSLCLPSKLCYLPVPGRGRGCAHHLPHLWV